MSPIFFFAKRRGGEKREVINSPKGLVMLTGGTSSAGGVKGTAALSKNLLSPHQKVSAREEEELLQCK